jgi:hypothetical protein
MMFRFLPVGSRAFPERLLPEECRLLFLQTLYLHCLHHTFGP